ncbi:hypothetical protein PEPS_02810 [Persicobacter psychrovividus]|uniref:Uncharacterized protein n=1 Tax=Persicobacter psychrovividus TaxID=387638 RepID=A0ABM7VBD0_9BACT|nr:hypothetical protein PEPS_02810 [Persicobacter psychrovividus]
MHLETFEDFRQLTYRDKIKTLYFHGTFIVSIRYYRHKVNLYLVHDFYVEVFYNPRLDMIDQFELFDPKHKRTKFYTDQINFPTDLLK